MYGGKEEGSKLCNVVGTGNCMDQGAAVFVVVIVRRMVFGGRQESQREKEEEERWRVSGMGRMFRRQWRGAVGVVLKTPLIFRMAAFWATCRGSVRLFCCRPVYHREAP